MATLNGNPITVLQFSKNRVRCLISMNAEGETVQLWIDSDAIEGIENVKSVGHKIIADPTWESPKSFGYDVTIAEEITDQTKKIRVFIPKSQIDDESCFPFWLGKKILERQIEDWTQGKQTHGAFFTIEGLTETPLGL